MRRSPMLLNPFKVPGALVSGVQSHFESVSQEPLTAELMELLHKMDAESSREDGDHGRGATKVDRIDRGG